MNPHPSSSDRQSVIKNQLCIPGRDQAEFLTTTKKITEYLCEPLDECLKDEDPYVGKTAAVCVDKMSSSLIVEHKDLLVQLNELLSDLDPMVVANALAALSEINKASASVFS